MVCVIPGFKDLGVRDERNCLSLNMEKTNIQPSSLRRLYLVPTQCQQRYPFFCENRESDEPIGKQLCMTDSNTAVVI